MNPLTAVNFVLIGIASIYSVNYTNLSIANQRLLWITFVLVAIVSIPRMIEAITSENFIAPDLILFNKEIYKYATPPRIAPNTALCFLFISFAYFAYFKRQSRLSELLLLPVILLSGFAIVGYLYSEKKLTGFGPFYPMAFHTGCMFLTTAVGLLVLQPSTRFSRIWATKTIGAQIARRFIPVAVFIPLLLGYLRIEGQRAGLFALEFGVTIMAVSTMIIFIIMICIYATELNKYEKSFLKAQFEVKLKGQILDAILTNIPISVFHIDKNGYYLKSRGKGLEVRGLKDNELIGKNISEVFAQREEFVAELLKAESRPIPSTTRYNNQDHTFETYSFPDTSSFNGILGITIDITDKKKIECDLQTAKEKAESANKVKSRFVANMSHEIRTPINAIMGFAEVLHRQEQNDEHKEYLENILSSGEILLKLIGEILDMNKIEEGKLTLDETIFNLPETITSSLTPYKATAQMKGLHFNIILDDAIPKALKGDIQKIRQIIVNLVGNALKFTKEGGIEVRCELQDKGLDKTVAHLKFSICDTGIGVVAASQHLIFESFTQADSSISKEFGGSGLGLSIVKQLVKFLGSDVQIISPYNPLQVGGNGTMFCFELKLDVANALAKTSMGGNEIISLAGSKVLIVDDNVLNRKLAGVMLRKTNCEISYAENGYEAIAKAETEAFDLILMDIQMPLMDGIEATRIIREKNKGIPIIALTANVNAEDVKHYGSFGFSGYISKPYNQQKLVTTIKAFLNESSQELSKAS
jgi:PAS domain S-box-containing protein